MVATATQLSTKDRKKLTELEMVIESGIKSFIAVGKALIAIRDGDLFTASDETFEGYCKSRWGFSRQRAYQLIDSAKVIEVVSTIGRQAPDNERQARVLAELPTEQDQANVWSKAVDTAPKDSAGNPRVTAAHVRKVAKEYSEPTTFEPEEHEEHEEAAPEPAPREKQPASNKIGDAKERIADLVESIIDGQPPHFRVAIADHLRDLSEALK